MASVLLNHYITLALKSEVFYAGTPAEAKPGSVHYRLKTAQDLCIIKLKPGARYQGTELNAQETP